MPNYLCTITKQLCIIWLFFLLVFPWCLTAQHHIKYYDSIINSDQEDLLKISTITSWVPTISKTCDSLELNEIYSNLSKFCYKKKEIDKAIYFANQALDIQLKFVDTLPHLINKTYNNLSIFYAKSHKTKEALGILKKLVALEYKDKYTVIAYISSLKNHSIQVGDYYQALYHIQKAEQIIVENKNPSLLKEYYRIPLAYSQVYLKLGSAEYFKKALQELKKADSTNQKLENKKKQAFNQVIIHNRFGQVYSRLKNYEKAIFHFEKALEPNPNFEKTNLQMAKILNNLGLNLFKKGATEEALEIFKKALQFDPKHTAVYDNLGDYYLHNRAFQKALLHYQKAIDYNLNIFEGHNFNLLPGKEKFENSPYKTELINDLKDKSKAWLKFYKNSNKVVYLENALSTIQMADYLVDLIRQESVEPKSRFFWRAKEIDLYMLATSIAYELNNPEKAFYFMEKSKSLALLENLTHEEAKKRANLPERLIDKEYELKKNIFITRKKADQDPTINQEEKKKIIYNAKKRYQDFIESLEEEYPNYYKYKKKIAIIGYSEVAEESKETKTTFIQYIISDVKGYGIIISPSKVHFFEIKDPVKLQKEITAIGRLLNTYWEKEESEKHFSRLSSSILYKLLPIQIEDIIKTSQNLVIIPDHTLQYFPFEVIQVPQKNSSASQYLIQYFNISYLYSLSLNRQIAQKKLDAPNFFLGIAPVNFNYLDLPELSLSVTKIKNIEKLIDADILLNEEANKANFIKKSNNYKIIHLSSHANSLSNDVPWIAFSDQKLTLNELYFIPNRADIVILDGCKTGIGELLPGESSLSLTRGFFYSGAKSVLSSLWNTNEKSSNEIIAAFYGYLKNGESKSVALRKAKLDFIKTHHGSEKSPYHWATLILTGSTKGISMPEKLDYFQYGILVLITIILIFLFFRIRLSGE